MSLSFRSLKPEEVQARVNKVSETGYSLLLYKDARCDQDILDETVGPTGWQRRHYEVKNNMYCSVGIKDKDTGEWIWKDDCGTESNAAAEKGEASDSFKRACVNWGIGRELYTKLFIFIDGGTEPTGKNDARGREIYKLSNPFAKHTVTELESCAGKISRCVIERNGKKVYSHGNRSTIKAPKVTKEQAKELVNLASEKWGKDAGAKFKECTGYDNTYDVPAEKFESVKVVIGFASGGTGNENATV